MAYTNSICEGKDTAISSWDRLMQIRQILIDITSNTFSDGTQAIEQMARWKQVFVELEDLKNKIESESMTSVICAILNNYDIQPKIQIVTDLVDTLNEALQTIDDAATYIVEGTEKEINEAIDAIFDGFEETKNMIELKVKEVFKLIFVPLTYLGAPQQTINDAVDSIPLSGDVQGYLLDVFNEILTETLEKIT